MAELREGDILDGRYRIGATIARGGMSTVHRATDLRLGRHVAAKVMDPRFVDDASFRARFEREARAVARMTDPTLVNVYDQGVDSAGHVFLIMELVDGGTLRELLRERGPMPPHAVAAVMKPVLEALSLAHERGMVHRDIKPENVLISDNGRVKLADFGLVRAVADAKITSTSVIVGTVAYLSPEQVTGTDITPASDVYSAGVLMFELLTGETPFTGDGSLGIALKRLKEDVPPPSELIDGVPPEFDDLVLRACARDPHERFATAVEFGEALDDVVVKLGLPRFRVPAPVDSASHRALEAAATQMNTRPEARPAEAAGSQLNFTKVAREDWAVDDGGNETGVLFPAPPGPAVPIGPAIAPSVDSQTTQYQAEAPVPERFPPREVDTDEVENGGSHQRAGRQRTRTGCAIWLIIALVATFGMGLGAWWLGSGRYGEVPSISGMTQSQAITTLTDAGFTPVTKDEYHNSVPKTHIIGTDPSVGSEVVKGEDVAVVISLGKPVVPSYPSDSSAVDYSAALTERTLKEKTGNPVFSDDVPVGGVVFTQPSPGEAVLVGSTVTVYHSKGAAPVKVPDVIGDSEDVARSRLTEAGLKVARVDTEFEAGADMNEVLDVSPEPGVGLERDSEVTLVVNNAIEVPDVRGMSAEEATTALHAAGLTVTETKETSSSSLPAGQVESTSPAAGKLVDPAEPNIDIVVSNRVSVPMVIGMTVAEARTAVSEAGLELDLKNDGGENALVITQTPRAGKSAKSGDKVTVRTL
ncbi:Stk1 family PASTA domain-containing Ser/Thr kinase [Corynebacterium sp. H113]|uniref:Stk1 family PASTA domain-containing Ser/Thr kinase n=1 Tax=Corynebacterium sp. H113 TaxID=3133419 RepID=UPI0030AE7BCB